MKKYILTENQYNMAKRRLITETVSEFSEYCNIGEINTVQDVRQCILLSVSEYKHGKNKEKVGTAIANLDKIDNEETKENIVKLYKHLYRHNNKKIGRPITVISNFVDTVNKLFQFLPGEDFKNSEVLLDKLIEHLLWAEDLELGPKKIGGVLRALSCFMFGYRGKGKKRLDKNIRLLHSGEMTQEEFDKEKEKIWCTKVIRGNQDSFIKELQGLRHTEYTKYEDSFEPYGFTVARSYPRITTIPRKDLLSFDSLRSVRGEDELNDIVDTTFNHIINNIDEHIRDNPDVDTRKFDLIYGKEGFPNSIKYNNKNNKTIVSLIEKGDKIEVKKIKYKKSSYLSEFLAMGKNSEISLEFGSNPILIKNYNYVISSVYNKILEHETEITNSDKFINFIIGNMKGMFFDDYLYTPKDNINFHLKDTGQRGDKEKRLSIWYEIIDENKVVQLNKDDNGNVWFD